MRRQPLSGTQHTLQTARYRADIASIGASLRTLSYDGRNLVLPFEADEVRPAYRGMTLAPWPNRIVDGRYRFNAAGPAARADRTHALTCAAWTRRLARIRHCRGVYEPRDSRGNH